MHHDGSISGAWESGDGRCWLYLCGEKQDATFCSGNFLEQFNLGVECARLNSPTISNRNDSYDHPTRDKHGSYRYSQCVTLGVRASCALPIGCGKIFRVALRAQRPGESVLAINVAVSIPFSASITIFWTLLRAAVFAESALPNVLRVPSYRPDQTC